MLTFLTLALCSPAMAHDLNNEKTFEQEWRKGRIEELVPDEAHILSTKELDALITEVAEDEEATEISIKKAKIKIIVKKHSTEIVYE